MRREKAENPYRKVQPFILSCVGEDGYPLTKAVVPGKHRESLKGLYFCTNTSSKFAAAVSKNTKASVYYYSCGLVWKGCPLKGNMEIVTDMGRKNIRCAPIQVFCGDGKVTQKIQLIIIISWIFSFLVCSQQIFIRHPFISHNKSTALFSLCFISLISPHSIILTSNLVAAAVILYNYSRWLKGVCNMEIKTTDELNHEIKSATDIEDFLTKNKEHFLTDNLPEHLNTLLLQKGISRADVVRGSLLDRAYVYQIFSGEKVPSRDKLIAIAFGLCLCDDETQKMLKLSGNRELYARDERDALILFALQKKKNIFKVNEMLISHSLAVLGTENK